MSALLAEVRKIDNLYAAWRKVRSNIVSSGHASFRAKVDEIDKNPIRFLRKIQSQLQRKTFRFERQIGRMKDGRPLVISSVINRVVHRALLNVLQSDELRMLDMLGQIPSVIRMPSSVGGVPERNVEYGIGLVLDAISKGAHQFIRSDIKKFFTRVPREPIVRFLENETMDPEFAAFFNEALQTDLDNADEIKADIALFPNNEIGVQQGSSLSAIAGNILLREFDIEMNSRGVTTIRYIDDFVVLADSKVKIQRAFRKGASMMKAMGLDVYDPELGGDKAGMGLVSYGFTFLGCHIVGQNVSASKKACEKILSGVRDTVRKGNRSIEKIIKRGETRRTEAAIAQTLTLLDEKIRGWGDAFSFTNNRLPLERLDSKINEEIVKFVGKNYRRINSLSSFEQQRAMGVTLLKDIPRKTSRFT